MNDADLLRGLKPADARKLIQSILDAQGAISYSPHGQAQMLARNVSTVDVKNVLRGGMVEPPDFEKGSWRYRVVTRTVCVTIAFRSLAEIRVVTVWRKETP